MKTTKCSSFLEFSIKFFKLLGLWRLQYNGCKRRVIDVIFYTHYLITVCGLVLLEFIFMCQFYNDYIEFLKTFGTASYHIICITTILQLHGSAEIY